MLLRYKHDIFSANRHIRSYAISKHAYVHTYPQFQFYEKVRQVRVFSFITFTVILAAPGILSSIDTDGILQFMIPECKGSH